MTDSYSEDRLADFSKFLKRRIFLECRNTGTVGWAVRTRTNRLPPCSKIQYRGRMPQAMIWRLPGNQVHTESTPEYTITHAPTLTSIPALVSVISSTVSYNPQWNEVISSFQRDHKGTPLYPGVGSRFSNFLQIECDSFSNPFRFVPLSGS